MTNIWIIITAIFLFALMIAIHEFGHFFTAKLFGIRVNQFAIGMGPAIFKKQGKETLYSIRAIPIGGFCQMEGEDSQSDDERAFNKAKWYKRFIVVSAGAILNIVLGFILFTIITASSNQLYTPTITDITPNTSFAQSGFKQGDRIVKIGNTKINIYDDLAFALNRINGNPVEVTALRDGEKITKTVTPAKQDITYIYEQDAMTYVSVINGIEVLRDTIDAPDTEQYKEVIGTSQTQSRYILGFTPSVEQSTFFSVIREAFYLTIYNIKIVYVSLYELIRGAVPVSDISGPIGIINIIGQASKAGWISLLSLMGLLTVNLGIMNLLPIPALDGGKLLIILIEAITKKSLPPEREAVIQLIGFGILIFIMLFATYNDILRIFN